MFAVTFVSTVFQLFPQSLASANKFGPADSPEIARLSDKVTVQAAECGNPRISLSDGHDLITSYAGPEALRQALEQNLAEPLSLTSADFDEDGVPDLVSGFAYEGQGIISVMRGNVDAIFPNTPEAIQRRSSGRFTSAPFLAPARTVGAPVPADFLGAGDFDADGHQDIVVGQRGGNTLVLLSGDGRGGFSSPEVTALPANITALASGEVNRADGLNDLIVAVTSGARSEVLIFEGPEGALKANPERFTIPAAAKALALGQFDESYEIDLAVGAADRLVVMRGRDRRLSLDAGAQAKVLPLQVSSRALGASVKSLAVGNFNADGFQSIAVLSEEGEVALLSGSAQRVGQKHRTVGVNEWTRRRIARVDSDAVAKLVRIKLSTSPGDELLLVDPGTRHFKLLTALSEASAGEDSFETATAPVDVLPLRLNGDALDDLVLLQAGMAAPVIVPTSTTQTFTVNTTADTFDGVCDAANCTLREALALANGNFSPDTIAFNIPTTDPGFDGSVFTINVSSAQGGIGDGGTTIDGSTQTSFTGNTNAGGPEIVLKGTSFNNTNGFTILSGANAINSITINSYQRVGIAILSQDASGNVITGCYIGTNSTGTSALANGLDGITLTQRASNNLIGGTATAARNVISGNFQRGLLIQAALADASTNNNLVQGNYIGTDATGTKALGNGVEGIQIGGTANANVIGGTSPGARNVISANGRFNVILNPGSDVGNNLVQGNYIGTDLTGTVPLGNDGIYTGTFPGVGKYAGIGLFPSSSNTIGGTVVSARNIISGNASEGIQINGGSNQLIQGNFIGTDVSGTMAVANAFAGVGMEPGSVNNTVGGTVAGAGNVIGGNFFGGVGIGGNDNVVQGNLIGTNASGTAAIKNRAGGVLILNASRTHLGGLVPAARNIISGNDNYGIGLYGGPTSSGPGEARDNFIEGNFIGTDITGTSKIGNNADGVQVVITTGGATNTVGGSVVESRNIISGNTGHGVSIGIRLIDPKTGQPLPGAGGTGITVRNNYIGTNVNGDNCLGNTLNGVFVDADSTTNTISDNLITCNGQNGIFIPQNSNPGVRIFLDNNSVFANASLGIDLGVAGITENDPQDPDDGANFQQNFPILTSFTTGADVGGAGRERPSAPEATATVNGTLNSTPNSTFTVHWYFSSDSQCVTNQQTNRPLVSGKVPNVNTNADGDAAFHFPLDLPTGINNGIVNCTATDGEGNTSEFSACLPVTASATSPSIQFSSATYSKPESGPSTNITVTRTGDTSGASSVNFSTGNNSYVACNTVSGQAAQNCDFLLSSGTLNFAAGQTSRTFPIIILEDMYVEGNETLSLSLSSPTGAVLGSQTSATLTITDNDSSPPASNPLDDPQFFVREHYYDFLGRLPDDGGLAFWTNEITQCGTNQACINERRVAVSNAFFFELEYQQTANYVFLLYRASYGNDQPFPNPDFFDANVSAALKAEAKKLPRYLSFVRDRAQVVGGSNLAQTQLALANAFVQRPEFIAKYPSSLSTGAQFVSAVLATIQTASGVDLSSQTGTLVNHFNSGGRGLVMFHLANDYWNGCERLPGSPTAPCVPAGFGAPVDNRPFIDAEYTRSFVYSQYTGYLRRDGDIGGFMFWLTEVSKSPPRNVPRQRAMVCSFMTSTEYQQRLSPVATHNNSECLPPP
ncbi:MAG: FG-GAP-like repeat-containing protein [Pyrinomonadaceae bacterium]